ncbi:hypothetical protein GFC29_2962 [Anoxybacillus sp. B7M1]|nr:hypothetical protein GFC28_2473 [Anoxybacillus sp. B2M1]ANB62883.1 hypothetical protein GFC29_2962 [Anoxybacillus sp. B7M1]
MSLNTSISYKIILKVLVYMLMIVIKMAKLQLLRENSMNKILLQLEGAAILLLSLYFYSYNQFSWLLFFVLLFAPDISMIGYLFNNKVGAVLYNLFHTYSLPIGAVILGVLLSSEVVLEIGLIWSAHIGMDRMIGYGLKYSTHFKDTHLNRV